jgi:titin
VEEPLAGVFGQVVLARGDGVTLNNASIKANESQNYPVLTSARGNAGLLRVEGIIESDDPHGVWIEFFTTPPTLSADPSGYGEGAVFLGKAKPDKLGYFAVHLPPVPAGSWITATATDANGNTSEFAQNIEVLQINLEGGNQDKGQ